jgi:hypothetical protein
MKTIGDQVFSWYGVHKRGHNLTIWFVTHFLCAFLNIWKRFCDRIMQLKVDNILNFDYVMKLLHNLNNAMVD